jgi:hypothetical protein
MSLEADKVFERSVDSIQKIYAVVIALAISQAIQNLLTGGNGGAGVSPARIFSGLPALVAFSFTVVPFWHGMNRHVDRCYLEKTNGVVRGALLFDFAVFFIEAGCLFAAALSLRSALRPFACLGLLLIVDMVWAGISHWIHFKGKKSHAKKWSRINVVALLAAAFVFLVPPAARPVFLMAVAILRTVADYRYCWQFYFPAVEKRSIAVSGA